MRSQVCLCVKDAQDGEAVAEVEQSGTKAMKRKRNLEQPDPEWNGGELPDIKSSLPLPFSSPPSKAPCNKRNSEAAWRKRIYHYGNDKKKDGHLSKTVRLTKKGENVLIESEKEKNLHEEVLSAYLTKDERNKLIELLLKVQKSASEMEE